MYIKAICLVCREHIFHDQHVRGKITMSMSLPHAEITDVEVMDTCTADELSFTCEEYM